MPKEYRIPHLTAAAERDRSAAQTHYLRATILAEGARPLRGLLWLLWTALLLACHFGGIVPTWAIVIAAAVGYPVLTEAAKSTARTEYKKASSLDARAEEIEQQIRAGSSGSTSGDTEVGRN